MSKEYNINELLEYKKELESQITEALGIPADDLTYNKTEITDHTREKNNITIYEKKPQITIETYTTPSFGLMDELAKVKEAIQTYNAKSIIDLLQKREAIRNKIVLLDAIKTNLPKSEEHNRTPSRVTTEGATLETTERWAKPMFSLETIEKMKNEFAAEERKLNTQIQKQNLDAKITLKE